MSKRSDRFFLRVGMAIRWVLCGAAAYLIYRVAWKILDMTKETTT